MKIIDSINTLVSAGGTACKYGCDLVVEASPGDPWIKLRRGDGVLFQVKLASLNQLLTRLKAAKAAAEANCGF